MKTKEIRASAIQAGDTVVFKKARNTVPELVGQCVIQSCSKAKGERTVSIGTDRGFFTIPWDRRLLLVDTGGEPVPPVADNRSETRRVFVGPTPTPIAVSGKPEPARARTPNPWAGLPPPPPVVVPEPEAEGRLNQQDRDRLLIEVLSLVANFVNSATKLVKRAAGFI